MENKTILITGDAKAIDLILKRESGIIKKYNVTVELQTAEIKKEKKNVSKS